MPRPSPVENGRRSKHSHRAVLRAAEELLGERGYANITIEAIAARAGVGKTTIYRWWPAKASIYMELYTELATATLPPLDTGSLEGDLRELLRGAFALFRSTVAGLAVAGIIAEAQSNPDVARMLREDFAPSRRRINVEILERAVRRGEISAGISTEVVSDMITGAAWYCVLVGRSLAEDVADTIVDSILGGVRTGAAEQATAPTRKRRR